MEYVKKNTGRPPKEIDWDQVDFLLCAHCSGVEIAAYFDLHQNTFFEKVQERYGISFTELTHNKQSKGKGLLRGAQLKKALGGNPQMLVWMGKQLLNQKEGSELGVTIDNKTKMDEFVATITGHQDQTDPPSELVVETVSALNSDASSTNNE